MGDGTSSASQFAEQHSYSPPPHSPLSSSFNEDLAAHHVTTSVSRAYSDLDPAKFVLFSTVLCSLRTAVQHPLNLALARKQVCPNAAGASSLSVIQGILRTEGGFMKGLSTGMAAYVGGCAISEGLYLGAFEYLRENLPIANDPSREAASGYIADAGCRLVHIPLMVVAYRQMTTPFTSHGSKQGAFTVGTSVLREGGVKSLFAGLGMTLVIGCQWTAVWWAMYAELKKALYGSTLPSFLAPYHSRYVGTWAHEEHTWSRYMLDGILSPTDNAFINASASAIASTSTAVVFNPFLVLRAKVQSQSNVSLRQAASQVYGQSGMRGFFRGTGLSISLCVVDGVLATTSYEYAKLWSERPEQ